MQHFESRTVQKAPLQSMHTERNGAAHHFFYINYRLKCEVSIMLRCWLCSTHYTAVVQIKNYLRSTSAIKIATMTNMDDFRYERKLSRDIAKSTLFAARCLTD